MEQAETLYPSFEVGRCGLQQGTLGWAAPTYINCRPKGFWSRRFCRSDAIDLLN